MPEMILNATADTIDTYIRQEYDLNGVAAETAPGSGVFLNLIGQNVDGGAGIDILTSDWRYTKTYDHDDNVATAEIPFFELTATADGVLTMTSASGSSTYKNFEKFSFNRVNGEDPTGSIFVVNLGTAAADTITGGALADKFLYGLAGNDTINGMGGADKMMGGLGNDTYTVDNKSDVVQEAASQGTDLIKSSVTITALAANVEKLTLIGTSAINGTGNALANTLTGNTKANILNGGSGIDTLAGGAGKDTLTGGTGVTTKDTFDYNTIADTGKTATTRDIIKDFKHGVDKIDLSTIDANGSAAGNKAFTFLATKGAAITKVGQIHWLWSGANTIIEGNTTGTAAPEFQIQLNGHVSLSGIDFIL